MNIRGTNKGDQLIGTSGDDVIDGRRGNDVLQAKGGNDILTGGQGGDKFVYSFAAGGSVQITDFDFAGGDELVVDSGKGVFSGIMHLGRLADGMVLTNHLGTASFTIEAVDFDGDGLIDTRVTSDAGPGEIILLGVAPDTLTGGAIVGG